MKDWLEPKSAKDIPIFIEFGNFYQCFIQSLNKITALLTLILKTLASDTNSAIDNKKEIALVIKSQKQLTPKRYSPDQFF